MCDNALISGFALDEKRIDGKIVDEICRDFRLAARQRHAEPSPPPVAPVVSLDAAPPIRREPAAESPILFPHLEAVHLRNHSGPGAGTRAVEPEFDEAVAAS